MTGARLAQVLQSRGVRGVILGPRWLQEPEVEMDCRAFSVVQVGYGSNIYRVCNNHVHACSLTLRKLAERGYRRIGLALHKRYESTRGFDFTLGVEQFRLEHVATHVKVDVWLYEKWTEKDCLAWIKARKVDAVVSLDPECAATVLKRNASTAKEQLGYANLDLAPDSPWSGIDQHSFEVGGTAMELLRNLLLAGERGMTPRPKQVLTEGEWRNGITTRKPA
jgi:LacI family transcriptional regulator